MATSQEKSSDPKSAARPAATASGILDTGAPQPSTEERNVHEPFANAHDNYFKGWQQAQFEYATRLQDAEAQAASGMQEAQQTAWRTCEESQRNYMRACMEISGTDEDAAGKHARIQQDYTDTLRKAESELADRQEAIRQQYENDMRSASDNLRAAHESLVNRYLASVQRAFGQVTFTDSNLADVMTISHSMASVAAYARSVAC